MAAMEWETKEGRCRLACWAAAIVIGIFAYFLFDTFLWKLLAQILALVVIIGAGVVLPEIFCAKHGAKVSPGDLSEDAVAAPQAAPAPGSGGSAALAQPGSGGAARMPQDDATAEWDEAQESGSTAATSAIAYEEMGEASQPELLDAPRGGEADDLKAMAGVGPKVVEALNELGVWHYDQIAAWTPENIAWVEAQAPSLKGRAERDDWVGQAKALAAKDE